MEIGIFSAQYGLKACRSSGAGSQHIHIKYNGLGFIPLNELLKQGTA